MSQNPPKKSDNISDDERSLFREAMQKPLQHDNSSQQHQTLTPQATDRSDQPFTGDEYLAYLDDNDWVNDEGILSFARQGLQNKVLSDLNKGRLPIQAKLDLHGLTAYEAIHAMKNFLESCQHNRIRYACIIHGKGKFGRFNRPILKNVLNQWLHTQPQVLAYHSAQPRDGGAGAVYVLIKKHE